MKTMRPRHLLLLLALLTTVCAAEAQAVDRDVLYQVSTLDALMAGVFDPATTIGDLLRHGDIGLGCFEAVDGEMVVLDGKAYQVRSDGKVLRATPGMRSPFATVTYFDRDRELKLDQPLDLKGLTAFLDQHLSSRNLFCVVRLDGDFESMKTRSVPRQHKPYPRLLAVSTAQATFNFSPTRGTLIGVFCPYFTAGANLPGWHFHYLTADRTGGGHVLDLHLKRGTLAMDTTPRYMMSLPDSGPYTQQRLDQTNAEETRKVEADRK